MRSARPAGARTGGDPRQALAQLPASSSSARASADEPSSCSAGETMMIGPAGQVLPSPIDHILEHRGTFIAANIRFPPRLS